MKGFAGRTGDLRSGSGCCGFAPIGGVTGEIGGNPGCCRMRGLDDKPTWRERAARRLNTLFPERQFVVRTGASVGYVRLGRNLQIFITSLILLVGGWVGYSSVSYVLHDRVLTTKDRQIANARFAYQNLLDEVAAYQRKFIDITRDLEENHSLMLSLVEQNTTLQQNLDHVQARLRKTEAEREEVVQTRERLKNELAGIQDHLKTVAVRNYSLQDNLDSVESDLQTALRERNEALEEGREMRRQVGDLETQLAHLEQTQMQAVAEMTTRTNRSIKSMERVVSMTGLDIAELVKADDEPLAGQGGPFVALADALPGEELKAGLSALEVRLTHLEALQQVMERMPLAAPLPAYYVTSTFGKRQDPLNNKWSMHYGLDMGAPYKSSVYATAPGVVTYAGWKGNYGKLVEIDHGSGIRTRYTHLSKILVKKGQKVGFYDKIALLGNTGRSTGAHLHYEVQFDGKPLDPMEFIRAGRHVFKE